ncbi:ATP-binding protein [Thermopolyspora sp. NPDC052614]|uniref:ATP-binding protein n=1 Tax=Thermopolyspora sp. NPDC052614 TaxID=3155682 RepID=UPI003440D18B
MSHRRREQTPTVTTRRVPDGGMASATVLGALEFPGVTAAVGDARRMVRRLLAPIADPAVLHDIVLLTSELAANAIRHTSSADGVFTVAVLDVGDAYRVEVIDAGGSADVPRVLYVSDATYGRGMFLVECLARDWGTWADDAGRTTWFEIVKTPDQARNS